MASTAKPESADETSSMRKKRFSFKSFIRDLPADDQRVCFGLREAFSISDETPIVADTDMGDIDRFSLPIMLPEDLTEVLPLMLEDVVLEHARSDDPRMDGLDFLVMELNARQKYSGSRRSFDSYTPEQCQAVLEWLKLIGGWDAEVVDYDLPGALAFWSEKGKYDRSLEERTMKSARSVAGDNSGGSKPAGCTCETHLRGMKAYVA